MQCIRTGENIFSFPQLFHRKTRWNPDPFPQRKEKSEFFESGLEKQRIETIVIKISIRNKKREQKC